MDAMNPMGGVPLFALMLFLLAATGVLVAVRRFDGESERRAREEARAKANDRR